MTHFTENLELREAVFRKMRYKWKLIEMDLTLSGKSEGMHGYAWVENGRNHLVFCNGLFLGYAR